MLRSGRSYNNIQLNLSGSDKHSVAQQTCASVAHKCMLGSENVCFAQKMYAWIRKCMHGSENVCLARKMYALVQEMW